MLDHQLASELLLKLIEQYHPNYIWAPENTTLKIKNQTIIMKAHGYKLVLINQNNSANLHSDLALLLTTSGSTGSPKLVRLSYKNINSNAEAIANYLSIDNHERPITSLPMHYSFGLSIINSHIIKGATILLTNNSILEKEFWGFLKEQNATSLSGVPYSFEILKKLRFFKMDLPKLTTITQAGGKLNLELNLELSEFCKNNNKRLFIMYGQTEATARMSYLPHEYSMSKVGSIGLAIPGGKFSIQDENGNLILDDDNEGELIYHGDNVSMGYSYSIEDLIKGDENGGILATGDIGRKDNDGFYFIVGRKKRFIKLFGNRINLDEIEQLLNNQKMDCACVGNDDRLIIFTTQKNHENKITNYVSETLKIHHRSFVIQYVSDLPRDTSGKLLYTKLNNYEFN